MNMGADVSLPPTISLLESAARTLAVVAVLLPAVGATYREVAFILSGRVPIGVGVLLPIPQLAVLGVLVLAPGLVGGSIVVVYLRARPSIRFPPLTTFQGWRRRVVLGMYLTLLVLFTGLALGLTGWVVRQSRTVSGLGAGLGVILATYLWYSLSRSVVLNRLGRLIPIVVTITTISAITASLGPTTAGTLVARIVFQPDSRFDNGLYSILGEDDHNTWLLSCAGVSLPSRVRSSEIIRVETQALGPAADLLTIDRLLRVGPPGFVQRCPIPSG